MTKEYHRQCLLVRGSSWCVSFIPERFAAIGKMLKLKEDDSEVWSDGWVVKAVYTRQESREMDERSRVCTRQRAASDV